MRIVVTREFDSVEDATVYMQDMAEVAHRRMAEAEPVAGGPHDPATAPAGTPQSTPPAGKRPRKPRADAGQPRGPYKPRGSAGTAAPDTKAKPEGASGTSSSSPALAPTEASGVVQPPAAPRPAAPSGEAPTSAAPVKSSSVEAPQAAQAPGAAELTEADVRATLGLLNDAPGGGMGACIEAIKNFGYERITAIPKEKYAEFDAYIRALLPKGA